MEAFAPLYLEDATIRLCEHDTELSGMYRTAGFAGAKSRYIIHRRRPARIGMCINVETRGSAELIG
jgi:hypothetical protein